MTTELNLPDLHPNGAVPLPDTTTTTTTATKRQRRPSVRLGDIGGDHQFYEPHHLHHHINRKPKQPHWNPKSSSKIRPFLNLTTNPNPNPQENGSKTINDNVTIGSGARMIGNLSKSKRLPSAKRMRSNWRASSKTSGDDDDVDNLNDNDDDVGFRDFDRDDVSDSGLKEQSPTRSIDGDRGDGNWNNSCERNGVRDWLNRLGLERYAPVFEIHEVDDEVLPLLTLEDLKDMGINAVGSRRKMYCSIQNLGKGFS